MRSDLTGLAEPGNLLRGARRVRPSSRYPGLPHTSQHDHRVGNRRGELPRSGPVRRRHRRRDRQRAGGGLVPLHQSVAVERRRQIRPRFGFAATANTCTCLGHHHHVYWRFDLDIDGVSPNRVEEFNDPPIIGGNNWHLKTFEIRRPRDAGRKRHWRVSNSRTGASYLPTTPTDTPADTTSDQTSTPKTGPPDSARSNPVAHPFWSSPNRPSPQRNYQLVLLADTAGGARTEYASVPERGSELSVLPQSRSRRRRTAASSGGRSCTTVASTMLWAVSK